MPCCSEVGKIGRTLWRGQKNSLGLYIAMDDGLSVDVAQGLEYVCEDGADLHRSERGMV